MTTTCSVEHATSLATRALENSGVSPANAKAVTNALIAAEIDGIPSHGLSRVAYYAAQAASGKVDGQAVASLTSKGSVINVDAGTGFAFAAIQKGLGPLVEQARASGLAALSVGNSHHFGVAGHHVEAIADHGLVGLGFGNSPAAIAPWGGNRPLFGTDPIAFASPRANGPSLVVDLSVSKIARGKIMMAHNRGEAIPDDWALDAEGQPTRDAGEAMKGSLRPIGDAKGSSLALMVELLTAGLSHSAFGYEASSLFSPEGDPPRLGQLFLAIDPAFFGAGSAFVERAEALIGKMGEQQGVRLPGQRRHLCRQRYRGNVELDESVYESLTRLASDHG
ncbi:Ldh family oxidoreductase [Spiribacter pallidus]|uniref:Ldh family oxidoreductase n=1 Tax=Spiribacter pallidus TaxID=1987936 RepID=UPI00349FFF71